MMASLILKTRIPTTSFLKTYSANISTTISNFADINKAASQKDAKQINKSVALMKREDMIQKRAQDEATITISKPSEISPVSGIPEEHVKSRRVKIFMPTKNAMQSGTDNTNHWAMEFETRERWENPLMGWSSSGDPLSNVQIEFANKDDAVAFCEKNGWPWFIEEPHKEKTVKPKSYAVNFSWNKRTRVSTK